MRLPLATDLFTRDGTTTKDAKMVNAFVDDGNVFKRPAVNAALVTVSGAGQGGLYDTNSLGYFINGDVMRSYNASFVLQQTIVL